MENIRLILERIEDFVAENKNLSEELVKSRESFCLTTGKLRETDNNFNNRLNSFLSYFIFDWYTEKEYLTPFNLYCESLKKEQNLVELELVKQLIPHRHSVFKLLKRTAKETIIKDLFQKDKISIPETESTLGFKTGTYFETRIFSLNGVNTFANYFIFHPDEVQKGILKQIKEIKTKLYHKPQFILQLHSYHYKWNKYRNININSIYHFDTKVPKVK